MKEDDYFKSFIFRHHSYKETLNSKSDGRGMGMAMSLEETDLDSRGKRGKYVLSVIGCGRMGLPTALLFAEAGFKVIGVDANPQVVDVIKGGNTPFVEPGIDELLKKHSKESSFAATTDAREAVSKSDIIVFVVPTTIDQKKKPDYSHLEKACKDAGMGLRSKSLVIISSTTGPGITETLVKETLENTSGLRAGIDFGLAHGSIRATAGRVLSDISTYKRVVGAIDEQSLKAASAVLNTTGRGGAVQVRDIKTAEAVKLFENVYRDVNISLANDFALLCEKIGVDFIEARMAATTQPYCHLLLPGIVGGHIPKDSYLLLEEAETVEAKLSLLRLARKINDGMLNHTLRLTEDALRLCAKTLRRAKVCVFGVSYRPNIKEARGSSAKELVNALAKKGAIVHVYDPLFSYEELKEMEYPSERNLTKAVEGSDCLVIVVGHDQFKELNLKRTKFLMKKPAAIVDMAHVIDPARAEEEGFVYRGLGRGVWTR